jgi:hypothetical protein
MSDDQYPAFEGGQTLTAHDLNQLRTFHHQRDRLLGRLIGFGINCGLGGSVSGTTLTIAPGLAIDQPGEPLLLAAAQAITLPPAVSSGAFDFVAPGPGGFSVVLEATETIEPAPDCGQNDCEGHAELHTREVALRVVTGRITGPRFDFAAEPLLDVEPMRLSLTSAPQGSYVTLRDAIVTALTNSGNPLISPVLISKLQGTSLPAGDLPGVKGYKAGFINQVLFATLDLLRCEALMELSCARSAARPGVVLGWVRLVGTTWQWDCEYRHAWEPPTGFTQALLGGTCSDPCGLYRDALEGLISGYAPPDPPPPPPPGGGTTVDPGIFIYCRYGTTLSGGKCVNVYYPPIKLPDKWANNWKKDLRGPRWNPSPVDKEIDKEIDTHPWSIYEMDSWTYFGQGVLNALPALGLDALAVQTGLGTAISNLMGTPNVVVTDAGNLKKIKGYEPAGSFSLSDTIVLTADAQGIVIAMGRVPAAHTARQLGTQLPAATAKADAALDATTQYETKLGTVKEDVRGLQEEASLSKDFRDSGVNERISTQVRNGVAEGIKAFDRRISTVEGSVTVLVGGKVGTRVEQRLDQDFARGMVTFAGTVNEGLTSLVTDANRRTLGRYVDAATTAAATLEVVAAGGDAVDIGDAAVKLLGTLRTAVKASGIEPSLGRQLDAQFTAVRDLLG